MFPRLVQFLTHGIWRVEARKLSRRRSILIRTLRVTLLAFRGFDEDKCMLRASALTFYSVMSIVPVFAMAFGIAKGFGLEKVLEDKLYSNFQGQEEVVGKVIAFSHSLLENAKGGIISGIGVIILFWAVMKILSNIEYSFNDIWGVKKGRLFGRKIADYFSIMLICPILFITSSSFSVIIASEIKNIIGQNVFLGPLDHLVNPMLKLTPLFTIWVLFAFLYILMPNTKVKFSSGVVAGILAGTLYQFIQIIYIKFQIGTAKIGAIYGSFAALPLFLVWLQLSWLVVLLGAELSFAMQNADTYEFEPDCLTVSPAYKKALAISIMQKITKHFAEGLPPLTAAALSHELETPVRLVKQVLFELTAAGLLSESKNGDGREPFYQPARDIGNLTIQGVIESLENKGSTNIPVLESEEHEKIKTLSKDFIRNFRVRKIIFC